MAVVTIRPTQDLITFSLSSLRVYTRLAPAAPLSPELQKRSHHARATPSLYIWVMGKWCDGVARTGESRIRGEDAARHEGLRAQ